MVILQFSYLLPCTTVPASLQGQGIAISAKVVQEGGKESNLDSKL